ncbi:MAG: maltose alpha-D-glucosyltransferase [Chloroflexota bacterium]
MINADMHNSLNDPQWYKDAIIYELHVRAFNDSNADGIGDFVGLTQKLDYLQDLGITALWLLPFYVSPLQDDGYDIADYRAIHPAYGTLGDFKIFLREAHNRGLRVITELVLNHTSDQHAWFQRARQAEPGSAWRDFYVWSDNPDRYADARVIFKDFEASNWTWDPVAGAYYWHRFYSHQPDLNFQNRTVRAEMFKVVDYWLKMGVDGLRLDAVPYLYEQEGTTGENLAQTHEFLQKLRAYVDRRYPGRMLLAEANQWPEDAVAYLGTGKGNECHMAFHFPLMPRLFMSIRSEDRFPIVDIMAQTPEIPETAQWALFLRNHDELTLEMVTDEERLYMYRVYAHDPDARINLGIRRRLAPLLHNDRRRIELMNALLLSLPGTPVIYYGDEIGMGDNIYLGDRDGVRTPMQWSADRNAGFSKANPQQLYLPLIVDHEYHHEAVHVEAQQNNPHTLLAWTRRLIALRKRHQAFGRGTLEFLHPENRRVLAFTRTYEDERILVVVNLSRFVQHVQLDLSEFEGCVPVELSGSVPFPSIGEAPYFLTLGSHSFYWFAIQPEPVKLHTDVRDDIPTVTTPDGWEAILRGRYRHALEDVLPGYLCMQRWFRSNPYRMLSARVIETVPIGQGAKTAYLGTVHVDYADHDPETYILPIAFATGKRAEELLKDHPKAVIAHLEHRAKRRKEAGVLYDAVLNKDFANNLLSIIARRNHLHGSYGSLIGSARTTLKTIKTDAEPQIVEGDLNNTSIAFGDRVILKLFRCVDEGVNPDAEVGAFLTAHRFKHTPSFLGSLDYKRSAGSTMTVGILEEFVPHQGHALDAAELSLLEYYERVSHGKKAAPAVSMDIKTLLDCAEQGPTEMAEELIGSFLGLAKLLGKRTAELHLALSSDPGERDFRPVAFTPYYQRSLYQAARRLSGEVMYALRRRMEDLPAAQKETASRLLGEERALLNRFKRITGEKIDATRIRCHGDYRLSQVLCSNGDFVFIDFEGEPGKLITERQLKRSPLTDVASMIRSFRYAAFNALEDAARRHGPPGDPGSMEAWARYWVQQTTAAFLGDYLRTAGEASFVPQSRNELLLLLDTFTLQKIFHELEHALLHRPHMLQIPLSDALA